MRNKAAMIQTLPIAILDMLKPRAEQEEQALKIPKTHISIAPMMDWTDRHCRYFHRLISPHVRLYTEMVTTGALLHGDPDRHLRFDPCEHPVALQLGGSEPDDLAACAKMGEDYGYDEINLNCGCPSERVQKGAFGACLMKEPQTVADGVAAMINAVKIPVTVKCRIGVDESQDYDFLAAFVEHVANAGCHTFIIHARKAWLKGLSPKENREIPPLRYDIVGDLKRAFPHLSMILNGGIKTVPEIQTHLKPFDGVMIGRAAYQNPSLLFDIESEIFKSENLLSKKQIIEHMIEYTTREARDHHTPLKSITRHMIPLFQGEKGSRAWRRALSTLPHKDNATPNLLLEALSHIRT